MIRQGAQFKQGRLFNPVGMHTGDPWKLHPDNWVSDESRGPIVWHASDAETLPGVNRPHESPSFAGYQPEPDGEYYRDKYGQRYHKDDFDESQRPMLHSAGYGSAMGLHFGTQQAAYERATDRGIDRDWIHSARIPSDILNPGQPWTDERANYSDAADRIVESGKAMSYRNTAEDPGSTSYRVLPENVRTWGEDVMADRNAHPALQHLARHGYNPTVSVSEHTESRLADKWGMTDQGEQGTLWDYEVMRTPEPGGQRQVAGFHTDYQSAVMQTRQFNEQRPGSAFHAATGQIERDRKIQMENSGDKPTTIPAKLRKTGRREGR